MSRGLADGCDLWLGTSLERAWNELGTGHLNGSDGLKDNATHVDVNLKTWEE
jgi:hypothetical protein